MQVLFILFYDQGFGGGHACDARAVLPYAFDVVCNGLFLDERAYPVVYQYDAFPVAVACGRLQSVVDRVLSGFPSRHDFDDLPYLESPHQVFQTGNPRFDAGHHDMVNHGMAVEQFQRVDDDGFAVEFEELLGAGFGIHPFSRPSGEYYCDVAHCGLAMIVNVKKIFVYLFGLQPVVVLLL